MKVVYEPKGPAREYSELAVSLYRGPCPCRCRYCYAPNIMRLKGEKLALWLASEFGPRKNILKMLESDCRKLQAQGDEREILASFMHDLPRYPSVLFDAMMIFSNYGRRITVLTKRPTLMRGRLEYFREHGFRLATSLSWRDDEFRLSWEPYADSVRDRIEMLREARAHGVGTWVSVEPVIDPEQALGAVESVMSLTDEIRVGGMNATTVELRQIKKTMDWVKFVADLKALFANAPDGTAKLVVKEALREYERESENLVERSRANEHGAATVDAAPAK